MKKIGKVILPGILVCFLIVWGASLLKCEILTSIHGHEFEEIYRENTMIGDIEYLKILDYSETSARVYYVTADYGSGNILVFSKVNSEWTYSSWETTVWSSMGSASDVIWPYWWHFIFGGF